MRESAHWLLPPSVPPEYLVEQPSAMLSRKSPEVFKKRIPKSDRTIRLLTTMTLVLLEPTKMAEVPGTPVVCSIRLFSTTLLSEPTRMPFATPVPPVPAVSTTSLLSTVLLEQRSDFSKGCDPGKWEQGNTVAIFRVF